LSINLYSKDIGSALLSSELFARDLSVLQDQNGDVKVTDELIAQCLLGLLDDRKANNPLLIDVKGRADFCDYMLIASAKSRQHVKTLARYCAMFGKKLGKHVHLEGLSTCNWVMLQIDEVVIHIFYQDYRDYYQLEKMWSVSFMPSSQ
jgi:ribosome-associated protein